MTLSVITTAAREKTGHTRQFVADAMGVNYRTLGGLERGEGKTPKGPAGATMRVVEEFYGWRKGCLREFWENRRSIQFGTVTVEDFIPEDPAGLVKASHLTDDELMSELHFRFIMRDRRLFDAE